MNRLSLSPLLWLAGFVCALFPINAYQLEWMGAAIIIHFFWSYLRLSAALEAGLMLRWGWMQTVMALFWALVLLSTLWSVVPWLSLMSVGFLGLLPLTFMTLSLAPFTKEEWRVIGLMGAAIFAVLSVWALVQFFCFNEYFFGRAKHPLADPNSLAGLFNLGLFAALGWLFAAQTRAQKLAATMLAVLVVGGIVATGSRGGFFAALLMLPFFFFWLRAFVAARKFYLVALLLGAAAIFFAAGHYGGQQDQDMVRRLQRTITAENNDIASGRFEVWRGAVEIIKDNWLTGTGAGTFFLVYPEQRGVGEQFTISHAHNDPLQFWVEMGIAAPILFYAFFLLSFLRMSRFLKTTDKNNSVRAPVIASFCALGAMIAQSHINLNLYNLSLLVGTGIFIAFWYQQTVPATLPPAKTITQTPQTKAGLAMIYALLIITATCLILSEHFVNRSGRAIYRGDMQQYTQALVLADQFGLQKNYRVYLTAVNVPMALLEQKSRSLTKEEQQEYYTHIAGMLDQALRFNPRSAAAWYFKGRLTQLVGADIPPDSAPDAVACFERALTLDPSHVGARLALSGIAVDEGEFEKAADILRPGLHFYYYTPAAQNYYLQALMVYQIVDDKQGIFDAKGRLQSLKNAQTETALRKDHSLAKWFMGADDLRAVPEADDEDSAKGGFSTTQ